MKAETESSPDYSLLADTIREKRISIVESLDDNNVLNFVDLVHNFGKQVQSDIKNFTASRIYHAIIGSTYNDSMAPGMSEAEVNEIDKRVLLSLEQHELGGMLA